MAPSDWLLRKKCWLERLDSFRVVKCLDENVLIRQTDKVIQEYQGPEERITEKHRQALDKIKVILHNRAVYFSDGSGCDTIDYWEELANASVDLTPDPSSNDFHTLRTITIMRFIHASIENLILCSECVIDPDDNFVEGQEDFLASLNCLSALLEQEWVIDGVNITRLKVENLLEDGMIDWLVNQSVAPPWHGEVKEILKMKDELCIKMRRFLVHVWL